MGLSLKKPLGNAGKNITNFLFGKSGPNNPYSPPDISNLLANTGQFDFLKSMGTNPYTSSLTDSFKGFEDFYSEPTGGVSDKYFQDLIGNISAPSSVEEVQKQIKSDRMNQLLTGIDEDVARATGNVKMDMYDRGLGGAGLISDIEQSGLAGVQGEGLKQKAATRADFATKELERLANREQALTSAYGTRYGVGANADAAAKALAGQGALSSMSAFNNLLGTQAQLGQETLGLQSSRDIALANLLSGRDVSAAGTLADLYSSGENRKQAGKKPGLFENLLNNVSLGFNFEK